jgi:hypothetical protein
MVCSSSSLTRRFPTYVCSSFPHMSLVSHTRGIYTDVCSGFPQMVCSTPYMRVPHKCLLWLPTNGLLPPTHAGSTHKSALVSHACLICSSSHMRVPHICLLWFPTGLLHPTHMSALVSHRWSAPSHTYVCSSFPQMVCSTPYTRVPHICLLWFPQMVCYRFSHVCSSSPYFILVCSSSP